MAPDEELPVDVETGQLARGVAADVLEVVHLDTHPFCSFNLFLTGTVIFFLITLLCTWLIYSRIFTKRYDMKYTKKAYCTVAFYDLHSNGTSDQIFVQKFTKRFYIYIIKLWSIHGK